MERMYWVRIHSDFESDHHLSPSFEALDTKAKICCEGSVNGKYILMACRCIAKAIIEVEPYETTVSGDEKQLNSPTASLWFLLCQVREEGSLKLGMLNTQIQSCFQREVHRWMFYVATRTYSKEGGSKIIL